jgi:hypothetical protein
MNLDITCPPFAKAADAKFVVTLNDSEHIGIFDTPAGTEIRISGTGAWFAFKKAFNEFQVPGFQPNRTEVPESYQRPADTCYLVELLMSKEKPDSKSYGFLADVVQKEQKWGLSAGQEKWLRDLAYRSYPDGLPKRTGAADGPKDSRLAAETLDAEIPF